MLMTFDVDFRNKLKAFQKAFSPQPRYFYCHETSVIVRPPPLSSFLLPLSRVLPPFVLALSSSILRSLPPFISHSLSSSTRFLTTIRNSDDRTRARPQSSSSPVRSFAFFRILRNSHKAILNLNSDLIFCDRTVREGILHNNLVEANVL